MDSVQLLAAIDRGDSVHGIRVFRFQRSKTLLNTVLYAAFAMALVAFGFLAGPQFNFAGGWVAYGAVSVFVLLVASALFRSISKARDLLHAATNVLVVAPAGVVCRCRGRVRSWPVSEFPDFNFVIANRQVESIYLNRAGSTFDEELVDDGSFGAMEAILEALRACRPVLSRG